MEFDFSQLLQSQVRFSLYSTLKTMTIDKGKVANELLVLTEGGNRIHAGKEISNQSSYFSIFF